LLAPAGFGRIYLAEAASMPGVRTLVQAALPRVLSSRIIVNAAYVTMVTNGRLPQPELVDRVTTLGRHLGKGTREALRAIGAAGNSPQAFHRRRAGYSGPVTAVWGDCDRLVPLSHQAGVRTAFPQARIHVWPGMGHHPIRERLNDLVALIGDAGAPDHRHLKLVDERVAASKPTVADAA
jgi:pimeloyl-ACP methyl ester carboxylesterase